MKVQHNMTSMNANRQLGMVGKNLAKSTEKLSSGYKINRAADDAAGLAISEKMRSQVRGLNRASDNAQDGISLIQTAEGAMEQQHAILQRTRELIVQYKNSAVLDTNDKTKIADEIKALGSEFTRINEQTEFNGKKLLSGSFASGQKLQVGANKDQTIKVSMSTIAFNITESTELDEVDSRIEAVSAQRSKLGAVQNRLEYTVKVDDNAAENLQSAESQLRDTDMADEMTRFSKDNILQQAATSMLAQANQANQGVLSLLG
jgi:flagellin